jgi:hypothetical protein
LVNVPGTVLLAVNKHELLFKHELLLMVPPLATTDQIGADAIAISLPLAS